MDDELFRKLVFRLFSVALYVFAIAFFVLSLALVLKSSNLTKNIKIINDGIIAQQQTLRQLDVEVFNESTDDE